MIRNRPRARLVVVIDRPYSLAGPAGLDGRSGLVFGFDGDRLSPFDGAMFALRKQVGRRTGLRLGLSLGFTDLDRDQESFSEIETISPDSTENVDDAASRRIRPRAGMSPTMRRGSG